MVYRKNCILFIFTLFFACENNDELAFTNPIIWESTYQNANFEKSFPKYWAADSSIYLSRGGFMTAFNALNGKEKWRYPFNYTAANILEHTYVDTDYIYAAALDEVLVLDHKGTKVFQSFGYVFGKDESYLNNSGFYFLKQSILKRFNKSLEIEEDVTHKHSENTKIAAFNINENTIYLSCIGLNNETKESATGGIYAIDLNTKELVWKFEVEPLASTAGFSGNYRQSGFSHPSIISGDYIINFARDTKDYPMICLNKKTGELIWQKDKVSVDQRPPIMDNLIFTFTHNSIEAYNIQTGEEVWKYELGHAALAHTYAYKGYFYFVYNEIMVFEPKTGKKLYTYNLHNGISRKSLGFGDDKIFVNGYDRLYALKAYHVLDK